MAVTPANTMFTLRAIRPSDRQELDVGSGMQLAVAGKRNQPDTSAPTNRIAAATSRLKSVGRREHKNVR
ncbi:hypothetical protein SAMN05518856_107310 [Paenibacillus sp. OK003]|nr:hypothetical protein SAMN05518856_107310 [Paenibacillus sp. OK003]